MKDSKDTKPIHYGKLLNKARKKKGIKKFKIAEMLGVSRPTLDERLVDNAFTESQLEIVKKIIETD